MTRIFLIRHAEAEGNIFRRAHGQFNGLIIGRGYAQIKLLRERFKDEMIDAVYSSDLLRAVATAGAVSETRGLPVNTDERLREVGIGEWEDAAWGDINYHYREMSELFGSDPARWRTEGSEKYEDVRQRMKSCISEIGRRHDGKTVAVISHGFAIRAMTCEMMGLPSHKTGLIPYCDNTAVALLRYENDKFEIEYKGDNSHLDSRSSTFAKQTWWRGAMERTSEDIRYVPFEEKRGAELFGLSGMESASKPVAGKVLMALLDDEPAGLLALDTARDSGDNAGWISQIFIKPELRRMYYGIQLLGQAVSEYRKLRREKLRLEAEANSPLMSFCNEFGFTNVGKPGSLFLMEKGIRNW